MQATRRFHDEPEAVSGTFETGARRDHVDEAHRLACEVERLLTPEGPESSEGYSVRITRALARSLIDALVDLKRDRARASKLA